MSEDYIDLKLKPSFQELTAGDNTCDDIMRKTVLHLM